MDLSEIGDPVDFPILRADHFNDEGSAMLTMLKYQDLIKTVSEFGMTDLVVILDERNNWSFSFKLAQPVGKKDLRYSYETAKGEQRTWANATIMFRWLEQELGIRECGVRLRPYQEKEPKSVDT